MSHSGYALPLAQRWLKGHELNPERCGRQAAVTTAQEALRAAVEKEAAAGSAQANALDALTERLSQAQVQLAQREEAFASLQVTLGCTCTLTLYDSNRVSV